MKSYDEVEQEFQDVRKQQWIANKIAEQEKANVKFRERVKTFSFNDTRSAKERTEELIETFTCQKCFIEFRLSHAEHGDCNFLCITDVSPVCPMCLEENAQEYAKELLNDNGNPATITIKRN